MTHELVIRGGHLVDGLGGEPVPGDLAVDAGTITATGKVDGRGKHELDAEGMTVTPGFIDMHTHLDAQICWDPHVSPVSRHGVTTALIGNCGVTFAPCRPEDRELLAGMMETVEDIPRQSIQGIQRMTSGPARILGLKDRGALEVGKRADINVFDADTVAETHPYRVADFPAGASRLTQGSIGYKATLVNGEFHVVDGEVTDACAGQVLRHRG